MPLAPAAQALLGVSIVKEFNVALSLAVALGVDTPKLIFVKFDHVVPFMLIMTPVLELPPTAQPDVVLTITTELSWLVVGLVTFDQLLPLY
jgi:hypothetical protein